MKLLFACVTVFLLCSCNKNPVTDPIPENPSQQDNVYGTIFFGSANGVYAYDLAKDAFKWKAPAYLLDNNSIFYEDGLIYTGSVYGVTAINAENGIVKWSMGFERGMSHSQSTFSPFNHLVLKDSLLYMIGYYNSSENAGLFCIDKETGAIKWERDLSKGMDSKAWVYSTPVVMGDKIIALNHGNYDLNHIHCLNRFTGDVVWRNDDMYSDLLRDNPIALDEATILFGSRSNTLYKLNVANGQVSGLMSTAPERLLINMKLLLQDKKIYAGTEGGIKSISPADGSTMQFFKDTINSYLITPSSIYVQKQFGQIQGKSINDYTGKWSWSSPLQQLMDTASRAIRSISSRSLTSFLVGDDRMLYYYEFMPTLDGKVLINSFFIIDAVTGKLVKESKLPTFNFTISRNLLVIRDGKGYNSFSTYVR